MGRKAQDATSVTLRGCWELGALRRGTGLGRPAQAAWAMFGAGHIPWERGALSLTSVSATAAHAPRLGSDIGFAIGIMLVLCLFFLPVLALMLDFGLALSIALSVLILMVALWIQKPLEFSAFPTVLLIATVLRAATSSMRLRPSAWACNCFPAMNP
jgi:hypothetical protein